MSDEQELDCLKGFDHARFGVLARTLQILFAYDQIEHACRAVRQFGQQTRKKVASPSSQLIDVIPVKIANALEECAEVTTVHAFLAMSEKQIRKIPSCGDGVVELQSSLRKELATGELMEVCGGDEELYFEFKPEDRLPVAVEEFVRSIPMHSGVREQPISVMDALKVLAERGEEAAREIDVKIAEHKKQIAELKRMRSMLGGTKKQRAQKPLSDELKRLGDSMHNILRGESVGLRPSVLASKLTTPKNRVAPVQIGMVAARDSRFMRYDDGTIGLA